MTEETKAVEDETPQTQSAESAPADTSQAPEAEPTGTTDSAAEPTDLTPLLEDARAKADEHWSMYLRAKAETENMRRRAEMDLEKAHKFGTEKLVRELLPVVDSMELGLAAASGEAEDLSRIREGMELTLKMMRTALTKMGVTEVNPVGEPFNPEFHQAMSMQESEQTPPNTVLTVMQKGYLLNDRIVRPAMVIVAKAATPPPGSNIDAEA